MVSVILSGIHLRVVLLRGQSLSLRNIMNLWHFTDRSLLLFWRTMLRTRIIIVMYVSLEVEEVLGRKHCEASGTGLGQQVGLAQSGC